MAAGKKVQPGDLEKELKKQLQYIGAENIMTALSESYIQQGEEKGLQKGLQQGKQQG